MKKIILIAGIFGLLLVASNGWANAKGFPAYDATNPQTYCKKEWTKTLGNDRLKDCLVFGNNATFLLLRGIWQD